jgi:hypothetical protein
MNGSALLNVLLISAVLTAPRRGCGRRKVLTALALLGLGESVLLVGGSVDAIAFACSALLGGICLLVEMTALSRWLTGLIWLLGGLASTAMAPQQPALEEWLTQVRPWVVITAALTATALGVWVRRTAETAGESYGAAGGM